MDSSGRPSGQRLDWETLFRELRYRAYQLGAPLDDIEDIAQEITVKLWLLGKTSFSSGYLNRAIRNWLISDWRKRAGQRAQPLEDTLEVADSTNIEALVIAREEIDETLTGLSHAELAILTEALTPGVLSGYTRMRLSRIRSKLRASPNRRCA